MSAPLMSASWSETVEIAARPSAVFDAVSNLAEMGRFSLENRGGVWTGGANGPALGATFKGRNRHGVASWSTIATVTSYVPPTEFAFDVHYFGVPVSRWSFHLDAHGEHVALTESWTDMRPSWFAFVTKPLVKDRAAFTRESIHHTLMAVKEFLEA